MAYQVVVRDTLTDTDSTLLSAHTGESGHGWTFEVGFSSDTAQFLANAVRSTTGGGQSVYTSSWSPPAPDYRLGGTIITAGGTDDSVMLVGRLDTGAVNAYVALWDGATSAWYIGKFNGGAYSDITSGYAADNPSIVPRHLMLELVGATQKLYVNGVQRLSASDGTVTAAGTSSLLFGSAIGSYIADFTIETNPAVPASYVRPPKSSLLIPRRLARGVL